MLAAGRSQRFGLADKLLQPINGVPLLARAVRAVQQLGAGPVVLVLGRCPRRQIRVLAQHNLLGPRLIICRNPHPERGMSYSLRIALNALPCCTSVVDIHLADMPVQHRPTYWRLLRAFSNGAADNVRVARPFYDTRPGHPVRMARGVLDQHMSQGSDGAQRIIRALPTAQKRFIAGPSSCVADMDTRRMRRTLIWRWRQPAR